MGWVLDAVPFTRSRIQMRPGLRSGSSVSVALPFSRSHAMLPRLVDAIKIIALAWAMYKIFGNLAIEIRSITESLSAGGMPGRSSYSKKQVNLYVHTADFR